MSPTSEQRAKPEVHLARHVLEAVAVWCALMVLLYAAYGLVDRAFMGELPAPAQQAAHVFRVLAMSLTATVVTAVWMLWRRIPTLAHSLNEPAGRAAGSVDRASIAQWFLGLRWVALIVLTAVVVVATVGEHVPATSVVPLWTGTALLLLVDVALVLASDRTRSRPAVLLAQVVLDVLLIAWLIHFAGGLANPFAAFFVFHAVMAGILLDGRRAKVAVGIIASVVLVQTLVEASGLIAPACVAGSERSCVSPDPLHLAAAGIGLATLSVCCGLFTLTLVGALHTEREKLRSILGCMADAVIFADSRGHIRMHNPAAARLFESHHGGAGNDLRVCHNAATWERLLRKLEDPAELEEHPILAIAGRFHEATYARVSDPGGELRGVVMVARDVTERLQAQEWRMRKERMAVVGKLAASLAHEINNPLGAVTLYAQHALKRVSPADPVHDHLETVLVNAQQAAKIVRDLLTYARQRPPERRCFEVARLVHDVVRTLCVEADRAGVKTDVAIEERTPSEMLGDPDQLRQVLVNLGLNAIDAMRETGGTLRIGVADDGPSRVRFEIRDDGPGIAPEDREKIFGAFYTTKAEGTGLGLAVARDLAGAHGGSLELETELGPGSTFVVRVPVGLPRAEAAE